MHAHRWFELILSSNNSITWGARYNQTRVVGADVLRSPGPAGGLFGPRNSLPLSLGSTMDGCSAATLPGGPSLEHPTPAVEFPQDRDPREALDDQGHPRPL